MLADIHLVAGDYADPAVFAHLADTITAQAGPDAFAVHYLAVPPSLFAHGRRRARRGGAGRALTARGREAVRP